jgi:hypothetical protein
MQRLHHWTKGHIEVLRAWQRRAAGFFADWPRITSIYAHLAALPKEQQTSWRRRCKATLWGVALCLAASGYHPALADTIIVDGSTCTLVDALTTANTDTNTGGCVQTGQKTKADTIVLTSDVTLTASNNSAYGATGLPVVSSRITVAGNGHTIARDAGAGPFRLLAIANTGNLTLQHTTLSGGMAEDNGGGIANFAGKLRLEECTVSGNAAGDNGGGVFSYTRGASRVNIVDSTLSGNTAPVGGGLSSITYNSSRLNVTNSTVSGNSAEIGGGAALYTRDRSRVSVGTTTVSGNTAAVNGGGVASTLAHDSQLSLSTSTLSGNTAGNAGGGVANYTNDNSTLSLTNSTVSGNTAGNDGGGLFSITTTYYLPDLSRVRIISSTVSGNMASDKGGGVYSYARGSSTVSMVNSTVSDNAAGGDGGGLFSSTFSLAFPHLSGVSVANSTMSGNTAGGDGGGLFSSNTAGGNATTLRRNLIASNTATGNGDEVRRGGSGGSFAVNDHNLFGHSGVSTADALSDFTAGATDLLATSDGATPTDLTDLLVPTLANNGGPTQTHNLVTGSPAIDAAGATCDLSTDQRGLRRPFNGDGSGGAACDIGAVEFRP